MVNVLVVDDKKSMRDMLNMMLKEKGYSTFTKASGQEALGLFQSEKIDIMITDFKMPGMNGLELLEKVRTFSPSTQVIVITAYGSVQDAVTAMKLGASDFIEKPFAIEDMERKIAHLVEKNNSQQLQENNGASREGPMKRRLVGESQAIRNIYEWIEKIAHTNSSVLIIGESGTGKELAAREIHDYSNRRNHPFIAVNCVALVDSLLEDELFGHEKGAFTGAQFLKKGRFEIADGGTLFLDEIAEMSISLQAKLLRVLQERTFERVGGTTPIQTDIRIIAATNRDIEQLLKEEKFRSDLYYRLNVITLYIPPLRERREDIQTIGEYFLQKYSQQFHKEVAFAPETMEILQSFSWPGNVRQLQNTIERGVVLVKKQQLSPSELPPEILSEVRSQSESDKTGSISNQLEQIEKEAICQVLIKNDWNQTHAAKELGIGRTALQYKIKKYGLEK